MQAHQAPAWVSYVVPVVIGLVILLRINRMRRVQRMRLETLWIAPAVLAAVFLFSCWEAPPVDPLGWLWLALALVAGSAIGWWRGSLMRITVDPVTHALNQQASPAALLFVVLLLVARRGLAYEGAAMGINVLKVTGILFAFALGLIGATRIEMMLRARRLLAEARRV